MASIQNKIIHRFVRPIAEYEKNGSYYTQVIPLDTQAYAIYPEEAEKTGLWYVLGDGDHTYVEIRDGKGNKDSAKEYPVFTQDVIDLINEKADKEDTYTKEEVNTLIQELSGFTVEILDELPETGDHGVIYCIRKSQDDPSYNIPEGHNFYDEYIWLETYFELIGNTGSSIVPSDLIAEKIKYTNENYPFTNVKQALDALLYRLPEVNLIGGEIYEKGMIVNTINLEWDVNKKVSTQYINNGIGTIDNTLRSYIIENAGIQDDLTYTITVSDGENRASSSTSILFKQNLYWGVSGLTELTREDILSFSKTFETNSSGIVSFDCSGHKYFFMVIPSKYEATVNFKINGFVFSDMVETQILFTNASGYESRYTVYRSNNIQTGSNIEMEYYL